MSKMKRRLLSLTLIAAMFFVMAIPASARASEYIHSVSIATRPSGNGKISIRVTVRGTGTMQEIGIMQIVVNEKSSDGSYKPVYTFTRDGNNLKTKNRETYSATVIYQGTAGKDYYITAQGYAKNARGSGATWAGSNTVHA